MLVLVFLSIEKWLRNINSGKFAGILFVDLSSTFDTVNHHALLQKLRLAYAIIHLTS